MKHTTTVTLNATFSSLKDLIIWRLFFGGGLFAYSFLACLVLINMQGGNSEDIANPLTITLIGNIPFTLFWLLATHKFLRKWRKKKDHIVLSYDKESLTIDDGRIFTVSFADIRYLEWTFHVPLTTNRDGKISESRVVDKIVETMDEQPVHKIEKIQLHTSQSYYEIKDFLPIAGNNEEDIPFSTRKDTKHFLCHVRSRIESYVGKVKTKDASQNSSVSAGHSAAVSYSAGNIIRKLSTLNRASMIILAVISLAMIVMPVIITLAW